MELKELLIFCSHKSDYLHCVVKIVWLLFYQILCITHSQHFVVRKLLSQSVKGGIFLYEVPPPKWNKGAQNWIWQVSISQSRVKTTYFFDLKSDIWLSVQDKIGFYHTYNQVRAQSLKQMFIGFMFGLKLWYRSFRVSQASISDRTTCIYKFCLGKVDTVQC